MEIIVHRRITLVATTANLSVTGSHVKCYEIAGVFCVCFCCSEPVCSPPPHEDRRGDSKDSSYGESDQVLHPFTKCHKKSLSKDLNVKLGTEDIIEQIMGRGSLCENSNKNDIRIENFATPKNPVVKSTMFLHKNAPNTWTSPDGLTFRMITS